MGYKIKKTAGVVVLYLITVLCIGIAAPPRIAVQAISDTPVERLTYGDSVMRSFTPDIATYLFSFYAQSGDVVTITMIAAKADSARPSVIIDPALVLLDPAGQPIAQNDDALDPLFGLTNARLVGFPIPASGFYMIHALRMNSRYARRNVRADVERAAEWKHARQYRLRTAFQRYDQQRHAHD